MRRTGIYGGSFDPIHRGHIAAAEAVLQRRALDRLFLVPAASPPHKPGGCVAPFDDRVAMARLAAAPVHGLEVLDIEGRRAGPSYSVETLRELRGLHPDDHFEFLVGADMLADIPHWREPETILKLATIVAFARPGEDLADARSIFDARFGSDRLIIVEIPLVAASSTEIRWCLARREDAADLLPDGVLPYIRERRLYGG